MPKRRSNMKRSKGFSLIELMVIIVILGILSMVINPIAAKAETLIYSTQVSSLTVGPLAEAENVADINLSKVQVKNIIIHQTGTTAQDLTIYKTFTSTTDAEAVATFAVPGTVGIYYPLGQDSVSTTGGRNDVINLPYFAVRTSTRGVVVPGACYVTVLYETRR
jgi:prepilin-type N-terminal cleavage/methylation domain-containing protein